jgi:hypothetical protein
LILLSLLNKLGLILNVGLGGVFVMKAGKAKQHVMRDFSTTPINTDDEVNEWLKFYDMSAPLIAVGTLVSSDPVRFMLDYIFLLQVSSYKLLQIMLSLIILIIQARIGPNLIYFCQLPNYCFIFRALICVFSISIVSATTVKLDIITLTLNLKSRTTTHI